MEMNGQFHALAAVFPGKEPPVLTGWKAWGVQCQSGHSDCKEKKSLPYRESNSCLL